MVWGRKQRPTGRRVPAVVVEYVRGRTSGDTPPESFKATMRVEAVVRVQGEDVSRPVSGRVSGLVLWMMAEGDIIPVLVDDRGDVTGFDRAAIEDLYGERKPELRESLKPHSIINDLRRSVGLDREQLADIGPAMRDLAAVPKLFVDALRSPKPTPVQHTDPALPIDPVPPMDGVSFSTFVAVQAALVRDKVPAARHDQVAQDHGVAPGSWAVAHKSWMRRIRSDPAVGQAFGAAYANALRA